MGMKKMVRIISHLKNQENGRQLSSKPFWDSEEYKKKLRLAHSTAGLSSEPQVQELSLCERKSEIKLGTHRKT